MTKLSDIKWNWGTKLAIWIIAFVVFILSLVYMSLGYDVNLVEKDYYPKGLVYQQRIDAIDNAKKAGAEITVVQGDDYITFDITNCLADSGKITFFRPSATDQDIVVNMVNFINNPKIPRSEFLSGKYLIKMNWWRNGDEYYLEKTTIIK